MPTAWCFISRWREAVVKVSITRSDRGESCVITHIMRSWLLRDKYRLEAGITEEEFAVREVTHTHIEGDHYTTSWDLYRGRREIVRANV